MIEQLDFFDLFRPEPVRCSVDRHGHVVEGRIHTVLRMKSPRSDHDQVRIEIHPHHDGMWMWGWSFLIDNDRGGGYRVGPKWGKFAMSIEDAIYWACRELRQAIADGRNGKSKKMIECWLDKHEPAACRSKIVEDPSICRPTR